MNTKKVIAAIVLALFIVPALASAYTYSPSDYPRARETLVEGHTVFAVIQASLCYDYGNNTTVDCPSAIQADFDVSYDIRANVTLQRMGTAVAVLVRDRVKPYYEPPVLPGCSSNKDLVATLLYENPGVLWFNDQFLVGDDLDLIEAEVDANVDVCARVAIQSTVFANGDWRYPCGGWIFATQAGNPDPRSATYYSLFSYEESYRIEDPNGYVWVIDKFGILPVGLPSQYVDEMAEVPDSGVYRSDVGVAPFPLKDEEVRYDDDVPGHDYDDGADGDARAVAETPGYYLGYYNLWTVPVLGLDTVDPGPVSGSNCPAYQDTAAHDETPYHDGGVDTTPDGDVADSPVRLYNGVLFFFFEDLVTGAARNVLPTAAGLGGGNTDAVKIHGEGAPDDTDATGCQEGTEWDCGATALGDRNDHDEGNSHPYNPNDLTSSGPIHVHPTAGVDLYFSNERPPAVPANRTWAVYDTVGAGAPMHTHASNEVFDDRVRIDPCLDLDYDAAIVIYEYNGGGTYNNGTYTGSGYDENGSYTQFDGEAARYGEGEPTPSDTANGDDCTAYYDGGSTGWHPSGQTQDANGQPDGEGYVPTSESYEAY